MKTRHLRILAVCLLVCLASLSPQAQGANLLTNGGFEPCVGVVPFGWNVINAVVSDDGCMGGNNGYLGSPYAYQLRPAIGLPKTLTQPIAYDGLSLGLKTLTFRCYTRSWSHLVGGRRAMSIAKLSGLRDGAVVTSDYTLVISQNAWHEFVVEFATVETLDTVLVEFRAMRGLFVWIDACSLTGNTSAFGRRRPG